MSAPSPSCPDDAAARRLARSMAVVSAFCLTGDTMLYIALPLFWQECGLTALWQVGVLLAVNRLVRLPLNPLVRLLYTRIDQRTGMALAVVLAASTTLLYGVAQSFALWLLLRCLWGLAWTLLRLGSLFALMAASRKDNRGYLMGSYNGLVRLGSLMGMIGGGLLADLLGFSTVALLFGTLTLTGLPLALTRIPRSGRATGAASQAATSLLAGLHLRRPDMRRAFITGLLVALVFQGIYAATLSRMVALHVGELVLAGGLVIGCAFPTVRAAGARCWPPALAAAPVRWPWWPCTCPRPCGCRCCSARSSAPRAWPPSPMPQPRTRRNGTAIPRIRWLPMPSSWIAARPQARCWLTAYRGFGAWMRPTLRQRPCCSACCRSGCARRRQTPAPEPVRGSWETGDPFVRAHCRGPRKKFCQKMIFLLTGRWLLARKDFSHG